MPTSSCKQSGVKLSCRLISWRRNSGKQTFCWPNSGSTPGSLSDEAISLFRRTWQVRSERCAGEGARSNKGKRSENAVQQPCSLALGSFCHQFSFASHDTGHEQVGIRPGWKRTRRRQQQMRLYADTRTIKPIQGREAYENRNAR
jgi:hypothetical protein